MRSITTVITTPASRDLVKLATVKDEFGITTTKYDTRLKRWITQESAAIETYLGRGLIKQTLQQTFTGHNVGNRSDLLLVLYPVSAIVSVTLNGTALTSDQWVLDAEAGLLRRVNPTCGDWWPWFDGWIPEFPGSVVVQYAGGYTLGTDVPPDIEAAVTFQVQHRRSGGGRDQTIKSETVPNVLSTTYWMASPGENAAIVPAAASRLEGYREWRI